MGVKAWYNGSKTGDSEEENCEGFEDLHFGDSTCSSGGGSDGSSSDGIVRIDIECEGFSVDYLCLL